MGTEFFETTWEKILNNIKNNVGESVYKVWFLYFQPKNYSQGYLKIEVPSKFVKDWLEKKFINIILRSIKEVVPEIKNIELIVSTKPTSKIDNKERFIRKNQNMEKHLSIFEINPQTNLNPKYRFDNFVVGSSNELAFTACKSVVKSIGKLHNPLFVYGPVGVGKTHLLQAAGNEALRIHKKIKLKYLTTEEFTNKFINSLRNHGIEGFKTEFRDIDILILDDVQFLSGKNASQEELFHTFNYLYNLSKQIIFSSDRPPQLIPDIEARLRSRFEGGLVIDINPPDYETRVAILKLKSQEKGVVFDDFVYDIIAQRITKNIRELEGALNSIIFRYNQGEKINADKIEDFIKKFSKDYYKKVNPKKIIKTLSDHYDIKEDDILKKSRIKHLVKIRKLLIYFLREINQLSYPSIGEILKKDHTTIIYSYEKISNEIKNNPLLSQEIEVLKSKILEN